MAELSKEYFDDLIEFIKQTCEEFGGKLIDGDTIKNVNEGFFKLRNNSLNAPSENQRFISVTSAEEPKSGAFQDFTVTIFPSKIQNNSSIVSFGIGSNGFNRDYDIARMPGIRRNIQRILDEKSFCKQKFDDIETSIDKKFFGEEELNSVKPTLSTYTKVLPAFQIVEDLLSEEGKEVIASFLANYAQIRNWDTSKEKRNNIKKAISKRTDKIVNDDKKQDDEEIQNLLNLRKYIVLQGPPGTGKTRMAKIVAKKLNAKTFFTQFHAETSYSDFIYGIRPDTSESKELKYTEYEGVFLKAWKHANDNPSTKVLLIIDEINRANLSNVIGEMFYLFEQNMDTSGTKIKVGNIEIDKLPENLNVIATMNTADRSLAIVDFALRRRFAWYDMRPSVILEEIPNKKFFKEEFEQIERIFNDYADDNELAYQPGQSYFIASDEGEFKLRIQYELLPLINEYLDEGLLVEAKLPFETFFKDTINISLFK